MTKLTASEAAFRLEGNAFDLPPEATEREIAEAAWAEVKKWVEIGYRPVISIEVDSVEFVVDLEEEG